MKRAVNTGPIELDVKETEGHRVCSFNWRPMRGNMHPTEHAQILYFVEEALRHLTRSPSYYEGLSNLDEFILEPYLTELELNIFIADKSGRLSFRWDWLQGQGQRCMFVDSKDFRFRALLQLKQYLEANGDVIDTAIKEKAVV